MSRVAVLGAGGFIGRRTAELLRTRGYEVLAIVRPGSAAQQPDDFAVDARDEAGLTSALVGCDAVVSSIAGSAETIVDVVEPIYRAAQRSGLARIVHLGSAAVHGQAPPLNTDEQQPLSLAHPFAYNRAKIEAESRFRQLRDENSVEVVMLRPAIVYGSGSRWIRDFANDLLVGRAVVFDRGEGICNAIYVDNLVHAIERALVSDVPPAAAFLLNDLETVRWRDMLAPVAAVLSQNFDRLPSRSARTTLEQMDKPLRRLRRTLHAPSAEADGALREAALLQSCTVRLPIDKAQAVLGYDPPIPFAEGIRRSIAWLREAGYGGGR